MNITFVLPNIKLRGGTRVVMDYAVLLSDLGANVTVVFPTRLRRLPFPLNELEYLWRAPYQMLLRRWFSRNVRVLPVPALDGRYLPKADVIVATAWQTAEAIHRLSSKHGEPYYFIQDIETYQAGALAAATYQLPFRRIVISPWIRRQLVERFGSEADSLVPNGLDFDLYQQSAERRPSESPLVVGALYDPARKKGFDVVLAAFERLRAVNPSSILRVFGLQRQRPDLPPYVRPHWQLSPDQTVSFYQSCDVWLCGSRSEGMHLPPMEAMACGCAVVTTRVGGTSYYAISEKTALVSDPGDETGLSTSLLRVAEDSTLRRRLAAEGVDYVRRLDVRTSAGNLYRALRGERVFVEPDFPIKELHCD